MFTGIVTAIGTVTDLARPGDLRMTVACPYDPARIAIGASIACAGVCLTVVGTGPDWFEVDVSAETLRRTAAAMWTEGRRLNLERALKLGDELGGHIVTGHVDGIGEVLGVCPEGDSLRVGIRIDAALAPYLAGKGSITVDGVSLTVNDVRDADDGSTHFAVNLIPHTRSVTTFGDLAPGQSVNLEIDVLARYLDRMMAARAQ